MLLHIFPRSRFRIPNLAGSALSQALTSGSSFLLSASLARTCDWAEYGRLTLALGIFFGWQAVIRSFIGEPFVAGLVGSVARSGVVMAGLVASSVLLLPGFIAALYLNDGLLLGMSIASVLVLTEDSIRYVEFEADAADRAALADFVMFVTQAMATLAALRFQIGAYAPILGWGLGALMGAITVGVKHRSSLLSSPWPILSESWRVSRWLGSKALLSLLSAQVVPFQALAVLGDASLGIFRGVQLLAMPLGTLVSPVYIFCLARFRRASRPGIDKRSQRVPVVAVTSRSYSVREILVALVAGFCASLCIYVLREPLAMLALGSIPREISTLLPFLLLAISFQLMSAPIAAQLICRGQSRWIFLGQLSSALCAITLGPSLMGHFEISGITALVLLQASVQILILLVTLLRPPRVPPLTQFPQGWTQGIPPA